MFSSRTKFLLFLALIMIVVLVSWLYAQQSYSAFNVNEPEGSGTPLLQVMYTETEIITLTPLFTQNTTLAPTIQETALDDAGCTLPLDYWLQNQTSIPPQILVNILAARQIEVCVNYARSEICAILGEVSSAADIILRQQFLVAIMNYLSGADPSAIENTINDAYEWLSSHTSAETISEQDLQVAQLYAQTLQSYNQGEIGPGACDEQIIPLTQAEVPTSSPTPGITTTVSSPTVTSTPTVRRTAVIIVPTSTEAPGRPQPTRTSPPPATNTLPAPTATEIPPPTPTQIPPPTRTPIPTPTPVPEEATPTPAP
jgi:hypothetical protein